MVRGRTFFDPGSDHRDLTYGVASGNQLILGIPSKNFRINMGMPAEYAPDQRRLSDIVTDLTGQLIRRPLKDIHRMTVFKILRRSVQIL